MTVFDCFLLGMSSWRFMVWWWTLMDLCTYWWKLGVVDRCWSYEIDFGWRIFALGKSQHWNFSEVITDRCTVHVLPSCTTIIYYYHIIWPASHHLPPLSSRTPPWTPPGGPGDWWVEVSEDLVQRIWSDVDQSAKGAVNFSCNQYYGKDERKGKYLNLNCVRSLESKKLK